MVLVKFEPDECLANRQDETDQGKNNDDHELKSASLHSLAPTTNGDSKDTDDSKVDPILIPPTDEIVYRRKLGQGAMGEVFHAEWKGRSVAAKRLLPQFCEDADSNSYKDFLTEAKIMSIVGEHPDIVGFFGLRDVPGEAPVILLELLYGPSLGEFLSKFEKRGSWKPKRATIMSWIMCMLEAVRYLHDRDFPILHRDIKPDNLQLSEVVRLYDLLVFSVAQSSLRSLQDLRTLKLIDFGVSRTIVKSGIRREMSMCTGTLRYMSPEVYSTKTLKGNYGVKADIYCCALVMWEICTGQKPFTSPKELCLLKIETCHSTLRPPIEWVEWKELAELIVTAWDKEPSVRPSAKQLLQQIAYLPGRPSPDEDPQPRQVTYGEMIRQ